MNALAWRGLAGSLLVAKMLFNHDDRWIHLKTRGWRCVYKKLIIEFEKVLSIMRTHTVFMGSPKKNESKVFSSLAKCGAKSPRCGRDLQKLVTSLVNFVVKGYLLIPVLVSLLVHECSCGIIK
ncbi:13587_t:CDS:2 [Funneliformis mosseae]|uniref:13587_t:CDS:1 n=1 Tax=Funneliformis mosseae TaxID=27381 RepID=A0A9N8ZK79_FUNMO|nr:13587_t:CDS:2 [Funneliformis mosseae]